jgi:hypothetical protein
MGTLPTDQVEAYREHGYLVVPGVLGPDLLAQLRAVTDEFTTQGTADPDPVIHDVGDVTTPSSTGSSATPGCSTSSRT